jgi:hypothetical protein
MENLDKRVANVMSQIPDKPYSTIFTNGEGYIQHNEKALEKVKLELLEICKDFIDHSWIEETIVNNLDISYVARLLSDSKYTSLYQAWYRLCCVDFSNYREYGQPFFAVHPEKAKQKCVADHKIFMRNKKLKRILE